MNLLDCSVKTVSGLRALECIPQELNRLGVYSPMVLMGEGEWVDKWEDMLAHVFGDSHRNFAIFKGIPLKPDFVLVRRITHDFLNNGHDGLIVFSGGMVCDLAKVVNIAVSGNPADVVTCCGRNTILRPLLPLFVLYTSQGSGYESTSFARLDGRYYLSSRIIPNLAVLDPRLISPGQTVWDLSAVLMALTQTVVSFEEGKEDPFIRSFAKCALKIIECNFERFIDGSTRDEALFSMASARHFAGCAVSMTGSFAISEGGYLLAEKRSCPPGFAAFWLLFPYLWLKGVNLEEVEFGDLLRRVLLGVEGLFPGVFDNLFRISEDELYEIKDNIFLNGLWDRGIVERFLEEIWKFRDTMSFFVR